MEPFFSIITPVYNCQRFLKKAIQSVIDQTYTSWELILIDDGSTDSTGDICDSFSYDSRIKVIHQSNVGELMSRIMGMKMARGIYELGLDGDDYLDKNCLATIKKAIEISGSDFIFYGYRKIGQQRGCVTCTLEPKKEYSKREILQEIIEKTNHSLCNKAIKLDKIKQVEYPKLRKLSINADYALIVSVLCKIDTVYVINDILHNYRIYERSISHLYKLQHIYDTNLVTGYVIDRLRKDCLLDSEIYNKINLSYLKMIGPRLQYFFAVNAIKKKDCENIYKSPIYMQTKNVEIRRNFDKYDYMVLKLFRYRQYGVLKIFSKLRKLMV